MTYSNRPRASPYQHGSEFAVSNDAVAINKINPFVMNDANEINLPGTWSDPFPFAAKAKTKTKNTSFDLDKEYTSPICEAHRGAGVRFCDKTPPNCPMSRPLEPQRDINPGMWTYYKKASRTARSCLNNKVVLLLIVLMIVLIMFLNA